MLTGLNSNTAQNIQLGAGVILKTKYTQGTTINDTWKKANVLSATNGGLTFSAVPNFFTPTVDGAGENVKGLRFLTNWTVTLSFTATEASADVIKKALAVASETSGVITGKSQIESSDYYNVYALGERADGAIIQITLKNALNTNGFNLVTANDGNGGIAFTLTAHYDITDMDTAPFEIETIVPATE